MERTIQTPEWERGSKDQVCAWLGVRESALDAMIRDGSFPQGVGPNKNNLTWHWQEVVAASWLLPHLCRQHAAKNVEPS